MFSQMCMRNQNPILKFDGINLSEVENNLVEAVRAIKQEETK